MRGAEKKEIPQPQPCPQCGGQGGVCTQCAGSGRVMVVHGIVYAWKKQLSRLAIEVGEWEERIRAQIGFIALLIAVGGVATLGYLASVAEDAPSLWRLISTGKDTRAWAVWMGVLGCSYFTYHTLHRTLAVRTIPQVLRKHRTSSVSVDIAAVFSPEARHSVEHAFLLAAKLGTKEASSLHLFASAITDPSVSLLISRLAVDGVKMIESIKHILYRKELQQLGVPHPNAHWHDALLRAFVAAIMRGGTQVTSTDLAVALSHPLCADVVDVLMAQDVTEQKVIHVAEWIELHHMMVQRVRHMQGKAAYKPRGAMNRTYTSVATPLLEKFSRDLTAYARAGAVPVVVGREHEVAELFRMLQSGSPGVLLVGEEGTGKTALVGQIAQEMMAEDVPEALRDKRLMELSVSALVAGGPAAGGIEAVLIKIGHEIQRAGNVILVIENVHMLVGAKSSGGEAFDLSGVLAELIERGHLSVIATTAPAEARSFVEHSPLGRLLARVDVRETDRSQTIRVLESKAPILEHKFKVFYSYPALEKAVDLATRYINTGHLPDKAIRLIEEAGEQVHEERGKSAVVGPDDVAAVVSERMQIPLTNIAEDESEVLLHFEERMHKRIVGQEAAVHMIAQAIRRGRVEMRDAKRPIASFLFLGPTGVGKTEVARAVANLYFGDDKAMVRLDMSEYQGTQALEKILGNAAEGIQGFLTEQVRQKPFSLVLLDEFEKASGEAINLFLQVFDDGRLTDAAGRTIDFSNTIIIATSNIAAWLILELIRAGESTARVRERVVQGELPKLLKPELLNRFDGIVMFTPLSIEEMRQIVRLMLQKVEQELNVKGVALKIEEVAVHDLAREGYDPSFGARPLRRLIQDRIEDPIAKFILSGQLEHRDVVILEYGGKPRIEKAPPL